MGSQKRPDAASGMNPRKPTRGPVVFFLAFAAAVAAGLLVVWAIDDGQRSPDLQRLVGRWQRTDEAYVLDVQKVSPEGQAEVRYLNPNPINVAKAEASLEDGTPRLVVELRDANYPGSTYMLHYDRATDQLVGTYFQAVEQITLDVTFERK